MKYILFTLSLMLCSFAFSDISIKQFMDKYPNATVIEKNSTKIIIQYSANGESNSIKAIPIKTMSKDLRKFLKLEVEKPKFVSSEKLSNHDNITEDKLMSHLGINKKKYETLLNTQKKQTEYSSSENMEPIVQEISSQINKILSTEEISVTQIKNDNLMIIDDRTLFDSQPSKRTWLIAVTGTIGKVLNKYTNIRVNEIFMADSLYANENKKALMIKASECMKLQALVSSYKINMGQFYSLLLKSIKEVTF